MKTFSITIALLAAAVAVGASTAWQVYNLGKTGISLELPKEPQKIQLDFEESVGDLLSNSETFGLSHDGMVVFATRVDYKEIAPDLEGAAYGAIRAIQEQPGYSEKQLEKKSFKVGELPGIYVFVEYSTDEGAFVHHHVIVAKGKTLWQVVATYDSTSASEVEEDVERIFGSLKIKSE